jgi:hypothetical protein
MAALNQPVDFFVINVDSCELVALYQVIENSCPRIHSCNNNKLFL